MSKAVTAPETKSRDWRADSERVGWEIKGNDGSRGFFREGEEKKEVVRKSANRKKDSSMKGQLI